MTRYWVIVSDVAPDLEMTLKQVFFRLDDVEQVAHADGVHVVLDVKLGAFPLGFGQVVVVQVAEGVERHDGAQRASADAEHDEILELPGAPRAR